MPIVLPLATFRIEPEEPVVGCPDPDEPGMIFNDADDIERNTRFYTYEDGAFSGRIDTVKRKPCSYPEISVTVFVKTADAIFLWLQIYKAYGLKYRRNREKRCRPVPKRATQMLPSRSSNKVMTRSSARPSASPSL